MNKSQCIEISLSDLDRELAKIHANKRIEFEYDRFKLQKKQRIDLILIGSLGQIAFQKLLELHKIKYENEFQAGKYDDFDFKINNKIIEIKTSGFGDDFSDLNLQYNFDQYIAGIEKNFYACFQIFIDGYNREKREFKLKNCKKAYIVGGILFDEIKKFPLIRSTYTHLYRVPLDNLDSFANILNKIQEN